MWLLLAFWRLSAIKPQSAQQQHQSKHLVYNPHGSLCRTKWDISDDSESPQHSVLDQSTQDIKDLKKQTRDNLFFSSSKLRWSNPTDIVLRTFKFGPARAQHKHGQSVVACSISGSIHWLSTDRQRPTILHQSSLSAHRANRQHLWPSEATHSLGRGRRLSPTAQTELWKNTHKNKCDNNIQTIRPVMLG